MAPKNKLVSTQHNAMQRKLLIYLSNACLLYKNCSQMILAIFYECRCNPIVKLKTSSTPCSICCYDERKINKGHTKNLISKRFDSFLIWRNVFRERNVHSNEKMGLIENKSLPRIICELILWIDTRKYIDTHTHKHSTTCYFTWRAFSII